MEIAFSAKNSFLFYKLFACEHVFQKIRYTSAIQWRLHRKSFISEWQHLKSDPCYFDLVSGIEQSNTNPQVNTRETVYGRAAAILNQIGAFLNSSGSLVW